MFNRKALRIMFVENDCIISVDESTYDYILKLQQENNNLQFKTRKLESELQAIKPIIESKELKPAVSSNCDDCIYCVHSSWKKGIIGCCKDNVCEDYKVKGVMDKEEE